jgi:hypothetical protein
MGVFESRVLRRIFEGVVGRWRNRVMRSLTVSALLQILSSSFQGLGLLACSGSEFIF